MEYSTNHPNQRVNWRVDEFCHAHGIGRTFFYDEVKKGEIKPIKIGRRTLVPAIEAKAWQDRKAEASQ
ncbi:MAG: excisionase [Rhodospirillaceae bacterium]|jgi:predicted DNA-binding transcriptional regulator AlpA|nr:excisionase [Rhodospirillaceae bacterium]MBT5240786.1 excisionase [Rhodospirillaceae bacterium]MBT6961278.1 excisionase [Rhodospirillaceae bacterium]